MPLIETLSIEVGSSIAKSILKLWLKDSNILSDAATSILDVLKARTTDRLAQQRGERLFREIGEKVGENLLIVFEAEGAKLDEGSRTSVALAVMETLDKVSSAVLVQYQLEPSKLAKYLLKHPVATQGFNEAEQSLFKRIIEETCEYIVDIASQLPVFTEHAFAEVFKRQDQILELVEKTLLEVQRIREHLNPDAEAARFELEYRRAVIRNLDTLDLFGIDFATANRRHRLSVAYVTLSVDQRSTQNAASRPSISVSAHINVEQSSNDVYKEKQAYEELDEVEFAQAEDEEKRNIVSVETALASSPRLLIRGLAGSGKTTLLQWIAVNAAAQSFAAPLTHWNNRIPFYIRLRQCVQSELPTPETFPKFISPVIMDLMPKGWADAQLASGLPPHRHVSSRAIVLIDGLDEVPAFQRDEIRKWLENLVGMYPQAIFIVTTRPHAVEEGWMDKHSFSDAELQPMEINDIHTFIDHWHTAVAEDIYDEEAKITLFSYAQHLKDEVETSRSKRNLATNPLLCAMLCALNRERRQELPSDRIELYEACCQLLIERRDKERRIELTDYPAHVLKYNQKRLLLEDLAYWFIRNDWSEVEVDVADERFSRRLQNMFSIPEDISGADVRRFLVERSNIIREPVVGHIDFTHRTFQEFLAARAALDEGDIGVLIEHANNDQWSEVIVLASGLAPRKIRERLIRKLIARGDVEEESQYKLHILAVSCLESSLELEQHLKKEVQKRLGALVPPRDLAQAQALAAAGELAAPYLIWDREYPVSTITACIYALAFIGGRAALKVLETYTNDKRSAVVNELWRIWDNFDKITYAQRVLSKTLQDTFSRPPIFLPSLEGFQCFTSLTALNLSNCSKITDLSPLAQLAQLTSLNLSGCNQIADITPLTNLKGLTSLNLSGCSKIDDCSPLAQLTKLTFLNLAGCRQTSDLGCLAQLTKLTSLDLSGCEHLSDFDLLANFTGLTSLNLRYCKRISDLSPLARLTKLTSLNLSGCSQICDLGPLARLTKLTSLNLLGCGEVKNIDPLSNLTQLTSLNLSNCSQICNLSPLVHLAQLTSLTLANCSSIDDLRPLADLRHLTDLDLRYCKQIKDLSPLKDLERLEKLTLYGVTHQLTIPGNIARRITIYK